MLVVLDGMRRDYFDRYAGSMPTLVALRQRGAWFTQAQVNTLPTNTAVGHSTISTGTDPRVHGITGVSVYDRIHRQRHNLEGGMPQDLMALTLADVTARDATARSSWHRAASSCNASRGMGRVS
jgi:predicted AlkP superfamily pyrophosphatase or phosphodiesterase